MNGEAFCTFDFSLFLLFFSLLFFVRCSHHSPYTLYLSPIICQDILTHFVVIVIVNVIREGGFFLSSKRFPLWPGRVGAYCSNKKYHHRIFITHFYDHSCPYIHFDDGIPRK